MNLSKTAAQELRQIITKEIGSERSKLLSDSQLNDLGVRLLGVTAIVLKRKIEQLIHTTK